jgi:hypothetical protein
LIARHSPRRSLGRVEEKEKSPRNVPGGDMVQLIDSDIRTRNVLAWNVLQFMGSSCSQKLRIFLNLKGTKWTSHHVDLFTNENFSPWLSFT